MRQIYGQKVNQRLPSDGGKSRREGFRANRHKFQKLDLVKFPLWHSKNESDQYP